MQGALPLSSLSPRERQVLELIAAGLSNEAIRAHMWVSAKTVESHVRNIYRKLHLPADDGLRDRRVAAALVWWSAQEVPEAVLAEAA